MSSFRRTTLGLGIALLALGLAAPILPKWALFLVNIAIAKGLVALGLLLLMRTGLVSFGQGLYFAAGAYAAGVAPGLQELGPALLGLDPTCVRAVNEAMDAAMGGHHYVKSPVDIACWDLLGNATGAPVSALLGGRRVDEVPLYRAIAQQSPREMAGAVERYRAEGYRRFQLKVGAFAKARYLRFACDSPANASFRFFSDFDAIIVSSRIC